MTCKGQEKFDSYLSQGHAGIQVFFSGPAVILKLIQFANPVKRAKITWKQPCIVSRKHKSENMLKLNDNKGKVCCAADQA